MSGWVLLTIDEALAIHEDLIARYGGARGLRDPGALDAALQRPRSGYYADLLAAVAALWESLSQNHPFVDGNKRVAFAVSYTTLALNGWRIAADAEELWGVLSAAYEAGEMRRERLDAWLRERCERV